MCDFPKIYIKFLNWSCVLNCFSERPSFLDPDAKINDEDDADLPFIYSSYFWMVSVSIWCVYSREVVFHILHRVQRDTILCPYFIYWAPL